jgi:hypothetical protein
MNLFASVCIIAFVALAGCSNIGGNQGSLPSRPGGSTLNARPMKGATYKLLYAFKGYSDGIYPTAGLIADGKAVYGMTFAGGKYKCSCGTAFRFGTSESILHSFQGGKDGYKPQAGLIAANGILDGTTMEGGSSSCGGYGMRRSIRTYGIGSQYKETILHVFNSGSDGAYPRASLVEKNGILYGTTGQGGNLWYGIVFKLTPSGTGYKENILQAGGDYQDSGHAFQMPLGGPVAPYLATDAFRNVRDNLSLDATLHDLRHTAATWMLNGGIDVRSVAQVLGHTQASTTLAIYSHVLPGAEERAVAAIDERLRRLSG